MAHSIQDYLRKINSSISFYDCLAAALLLMTLGAFTLYLHHEQERLRLPVIYRTGKTVVRPTVNSRPFGSRKGTTYTYTWCSGSGQIKEANKLYWKNREAAEASGRTFSKLCTK